MKQLDRNILTLLFGAAGLLFLIVLLLALATGNLHLDVHETSQYTTSYENINVTKAKELLALEANITVIDCRGLEGCSTCQFKRGHLPDAVLNSKPESLYNSTDDILVYSKDGAKGIWFCEQLVDHTYGKIYNLQGGYAAWEKSEE